MYNITFQQLATFFSVAERLNISETANAMYISQSALSKTIQRLEEGLNLKLFVRSNRGLSLTKEGEFLRNKLRSSYDSMCKNIEYARIIQSQPLKVVRIGYPSTYDCSEDYDKLKQHISDYAAEHPEVELSEMLYDFIELKNALTFGSVDIAFTHDFILREMTNITMKKVCRARMCLAMSAKHPLASRSSLKDIDESEFENEVFYTIPFTDESANRKTTIQRLNGYGISPKDVRFVQNFHSLIRILRQGKGMSICGYFPKAPGHEEIKFLEFPSQKHDPFMAAAWRTGDLSAEAQALLDTIPDDPEMMTVFEHRED